MKQQFNAYLGVTIGILALIIVGTAAFSFQQKGWVYAFLDGQLLIPREEVFTELYFSDHTRLPSQIKKGDMIVIPFTIHNREGRTMEYPYEVVLIREGATSSIPLASGSTTLGNLERKMITVEASFARSPGESVIAVRLPLSKHEIRFHINSLN